MSKRINQMEPWIGQEEQKAMAEYLSSGGWLTEFKKTREFEQMISQYTGAKYVSVVANGTLALMAAITACGIKKNDEVLVPDYTMVASANAVVLAGAKPVFVDIDQKTLNIDFKLLKKAITKKTKAIMLVTINGRSSEMEKFVTFAKKHSLHLIEDAAQSLGSTYKGKHLGTFGDVGVFSFSTPKIITTGQGGCVVTDNEEIYKKVLAIKDFGRIKGGVDIHESMGFNFKFTDMQAVLGIEQMKKLAFRVQRKKEIYALYKKLLATVKEVEFIETNLEDVSPWFIDILVPPKKRGQLIAFLETKQIGSRPFYPAIHTQKPYHLVKGSFKNSVAISEKGLWLPSSSFLTDEDITVVCDGIKEFFANEK